MQEQTPEEPVEPTNPNVLPPDESQSPAAPVIPPGPPGYDPDAEDVPVYGGQPQPETEVQPADEPDADDDG